MTHPPSDVTARVGLLAGAAALLLAGCSSGRDGTAADPPPRTHPASPAPRTPADGTDLNACKDGICEVTVSGPARIPVDRKTSRLTGLRVTSIKGDTVSFAVKAPRTLDARICDDKDCVNFGSSAVASGGASTQATGEATGPAGSRMTANGIVVTVLSVAGGSAILRLALAD